MKDLYNNIKVMNALDTKAIASNTTTAGEIIDLKGFDSLAFIFQTGTITDGDYTLLIQEGDESDLSDAGAVADDDLLGTEAAASFTADTDDNAVSKIGYRGNKRYVRISVISTNVTTGGTVGAIAVLGHPSIAPVA
ncbi:hypothetical protein [Acetobacterium wieringae]|uniref:hypothetical protein n=1 Tax=Acetobacterium wieringae TaxID=52694 RepID=UPI00203452DF|nr:hypothetical protein [Acetobacterium wieringae]URN85866.1 hypothetical protein CHL1_001541 [Acetobacterium wieringae]